MINFDYNGENYAREFEKLNDGIFYGELIYIFGENIGIYGMKYNKYDPLYKYEVVKNPNMEKKSSFSQANPVLPPHVLYSPLIDTLEKGTSYNFKIKCKSARQMFVIDDLDNMFELTKNDITFSQQLTVNNTASKVAIIGYLLDSEEMTPFYLYNISDI